MCLIHSPLLILPSLPFACPSAYVCNYKLLFRINCIESRLGHRQFINAQLININEHKFLIFSFMFFFFFGFSLFFVLFAICRAQSKFQFNWKLCHGININRKLMAKRNKATKRSPTTYTSTSSLASFILRQTIKKKKYKQNSINVRKLSSEGVRQLVGRQLFKPNQIIYGL